MQKKKIKELRTAGGKLSGKGHGKIKRYFLKTHHPCTFYTPLTQVGRPGMPPPQQTRLRKRGTAPPALHGRPRHARPVSPQPSAPDMPQPVHATPPPRPAWSCRRTNPACVCKSGAAFVWRRRAGALGVKLLIAGRGRPLKGGARSWEYRELNIVD